LSGLSSSMSGSVRGQKTAKSGDAGEPHRPTVSRPALDDLRQLLV
jgi:hypothetical protein